MPTTTTVTPPRNGTESNEPNGEAPVYRAPSLDQFGDLFRPLAAPVFPKPPREYDPDEVERVQQQRQRMQADHEARIRLQAGLRQVVETGEVKIGDQTFKLSPEQATAYIRRFQEGIVPDANSLALMALGPDILAQARKAGEKIGRGVERTDQQPDPSRRPDVDPKVVGGENDRIIDLGASGKKKKPPGKADKYVSEVPAKDVNFRDLFALTMYDELGPEKFAAMQAGKLRTEPIFEDD